MFKKIAIWAGSSRNYGDMALLLGQKQQLQKYTNHLLEFTDLNSDLMANPKFDSAPEPQLSIEMVEYLNATHDMLMIGGGGQLMKRNNNSKWQFNCSIEVLEALKIPLVVQSIGYNKFPLEEHFAKDFAHHLSKVRDKASLFSVRNNGTAEILNLVNIKDVEVVPDPAIFVQGRDLEFKNIEPNEFVVGLNFAGDSPEKRFENGELDLGWLIINTIKTAVALIAKMGGGKILYIPHVSYWDLRLSSRIETVAKPLMKNLAIEAPWLYPESQFTTPWFVGAYKRIDVMLGQRSHANILAFGQGKPSFSIGDQDKVKFFQKDVGGLHLGKNPEEHITEICDMVVSNYGKTQLDILNKRMELEKKYVDFTKRTLALL